MRKSVPVWTPFTAITGLLEDLTRWHSLWSGALINQERHEAVILINRVDGEARNVVGVLL